MPKNTGDQRLSFYRAFIAWVCELKRSNNPENYRLKVAPYGYRIQEGRLVLNKVELRICRLVVELMLKKGFTGSATARALGEKGYKNCNNSMKWDHSTVRNIFERWKNKL